MWPQASNELYAKSPSKRASVFRIAAREVRGRGSIIRNQDIVISSRIPFLPRMAVAGLHHAAVAAAVRQLAEATA